MKEMVLDLITSYEKRISVVEGLTATYEATTASGDGLGELEKEREKLKVGLRETLVRNCSLRRKDFDSLMEKALADSEKKREEVEAERQQCRKKLKEFLEEQKKLAASLREQLVQFAAEKAERDSLEKITGSIKTAYQDKGEQVLSLLRDFQSRLDVFRREQEEINRRLQRLIDRGESLKVADLRQLEAVRARQERKAERELRQEEIERLLRRFKQQRQGSSQPR